MINYQGRATTGQHLEDLACGYWLSETLFAALRLALFAHLEPGPLPLAGLARRADCQEAPLARLLLALEGLGLVECEAGGWRNAPLASRHLVPDQPEFLGDFLLYRRYLTPSWHDLAPRVAGRELAPELSREDDYQTRTYHYVRALDQLARVKAVEIERRLTADAWAGPILDIGGGAGAVSRRLRRPGETVVLLELPEVLSAARRLYPQPEDWRGIAGEEGDFRDPHRPAGRRFGLIIMANFLHTYEPEEARRLTAKAAGLLAPDGLLLIHDYFPDRTPRQGRLYDLNMLLNTAAGVCHPAQDVSYWLAGLGLTPQTLDLPSDSGLILARRPPSCP
ncbi:MAG: methyltransferase [Desulfobacteraceae bacterium]|nr:methyltransferase [Desulfobacteraceae bacterium]